MPATTTKAKSTTRGKSTKSATDHLQEALHSLDEARAGDELRDFEETLERAGDQVRLEAGLRGIRVQRDGAALTKLSAEIRKRRAELEKS